MRWDLALRVLLVVPALTLVLLQGLNNAVMAGSASLAALLILLADYRRPNVGAYLLTAGGCLLATGLGAVPLSPVPTVALVAIASALLAVLRGFGGFLAVASVTIVAELLIAVGLRTSGADPIDLLIGVAVGATASVVVATIYPVPRSALTTALEDLIQRCVETLRGSPHALHNAGQDLVRSYLEAGNRPQAPTRGSSDELHRLSAAARLGDLLQGSHAPTEFTRACAAALSSNCPAPAGSSSWEKQVSYAVTVLGRPRLPTGEWVRQLKVRLRPDSLLFVQAAIAAVLYGSVTALVLFLQPPHPQWILLGAVTATYPYARRAVIVVRNLLLGTVLAFAALLAIAPLANSHPAMWWVAFIVACGAASGVPHTTAGWIVGQMAFTSISLSLLALTAGHLPSNAIAVRMENVLIGGAAAIVVALLLAPRHMRQRLQMALADLYDVTAIPDLSLARAHFLRCTDVVDSMRGSGFLGMDRLVHWLDAARCAVQTGVVHVLTKADATPTNRAYADALRADRSVPSYTGDDPSLGALFATQQAELADLSPLLPRRALEE